VDESSSLDEPDRRAADPLRDDGGLDWEALKAGGRLHLFCYLRETVLALASLDVAA
jgi:hypothetical protein